MTVQPGSRELVSRQRIVLATRGRAEGEDGTGKRQAMLVNMGHVTDLGGGHVRAPKDLTQR